MLTRINNFVKVSMTKWRQAQEWRVSCTQIYIIFTAHRKDVRIVVI